MYSKFSIKSIIYSIVIICLSVLIPYYIFSLSDNTKPQEEGKAIICIFIAGITIIYFFVIEFRLKLIKVKINGDILQVRKYAGLAKTIEYKLSNLDGYKISYTVLRSGKFEQLLLIKDNKKIISISEFHIGNYKDLKGNIKRKIPGLGIENYDFIDEVIDIFKRDKN